MVRRGRRTLKRLTVAGSYGVAGVAFAVAVMTGYALWQGPQAKLAPAYGIEDGQGSVATAFDAARASAAEALPAAKMAVAEAPRPPASPPADVVLAGAVRANSPLATSRAAPAFAASSATAGAPMEATKSLPDSFQNGLLTFRAKDQPLQEALDNISRMTNVPILVADEVKGERVSVEFRNYRLDEALRQILRNYDIFFSYASSSDSLGNPTLRMVWVYPPNHGSGMD
jgi:hypothetical protein